MTDIDLANTFYKSGDFRKALEICKQLIGAHPEDVDVLNVMARCLLRMEKYDDAEDAIQVALKSNPNSAESHMILSSIFLYTGRLDESENAAKKTLEVDKHSSNAYNNLGAIYVSRNQYRSAHPLLLKALELNPRNWLAYYNLLLVHTRLSEFDKSINTMGQMLKIQNSITGLSEIASALEIGGHPWFSIVVTICLTVVMSLAMPSNSDVPFEFSLIWLFVITACEIIVSYGALRSEILRPTLRKWVIGLRLRRVSLYVGWFLVLLWLRKIS